MKRFLLAFAAAAALAACGTGGGNTDGGSSGGAGGGSGGGSAGGNGGGSAGGSGGGSAGGSGANDGGSDAGTAGCTITLSGALSGNYPCAVIAPSLGTTGIDADFQPLSGSTDAGLTNLAGSGGGANPDITFGLSFNGDMKTGSYTTANTTVVGAGAALANGNSWLLDSSQPIGTFAGATFGTSVLVEMGSDGSKHYAVSNGAFDATLVQTWPPGGDAGTVTLHVAY